MGDIFLKLEGIEGESKDEKHPNEIEVEAYSWGLSAPSSIGTAGGGGAGKAQAQDLNFTFRNNRASAKLMAAAFRGDHIKSGVLVARKQGGKGGQVEFLKITFNDIMVTTFQTSAAGDDSRGMDNCSFAFTKVMYEYFPQKPDGTLEGAVKAGYDVSMQKSLT